MLKLNSRFYQELSKKKDDFWLNISPSDEALLEDRYYVGSIGDDFYEKVVIPLEDMLLPYDIKFH